MFKNVWLFLVGSGLIGVVATLGWMECRDWHKSNLPVKSIGPIPKSDRGGFDAGFQNESTVPRQCLKALFIIRPKGKRPYAASMPVNEIVFTKADYRSPSPKRPHAWYEKNISNMTMPAGEFGGFGIKIVDRRFANQSLRGLFIVTYGDRRSPETLNLGAWDVMPTRR